MFDFMQMANSPKAQEMVFSLLSQQMGRVPPEMRQAVSRVEVVVKRNERGFEIRLGKSDDARVEDVLKESTDNWVNFLSRAFQAAGYRVKIYE